VRDNRREELIAMATGASSELLRTPASTARTGGPPAAALSALGLAGIASAIALGDAGEADTLYGALRLFVGLSFIGVGLYAWSRRPSNRVGVLMTATGFLWFLVNATPYATDATVFTLTGLFGSLYHATTIHLLVVFPSGRAETRSARIAVAAGYVVVAGGNLLVYLVSDPTRDFGCAGCPENVLQSVHSAGVADAVIKGVNLLATALVVYVLVQVIANWRSSRGWRRRALTSLLFASAASAFLLGLTFLVLAFDRQVAEDVFIAAVAAFATVPYAFLIGLARGAMLSGGAVGELVERLTESPAGDELRAALRDALGDPSLELGYWLPDSETFVDADGRAMELPVPDDVRASAGVDLDGRAVGAIVYDPRVVDDPHLVHAAGAAAALAIERERLDAELRAKIAELRTSRERIVEVAYEERRRLERDLHDGAQQRLVSLALELRMARAKLGPDPSRVEELLDTAATELDEALGELRELARGIHPAILSDHGLSAALTSLAARTPFDVSVEGAPAGRLADKVELAAYFFVSEALANAVRHARATHARVTLAQDDEVLTIEVADDGVGGADPGKGSGLRGLSDRLSALGGRLDVDSRSGGGTALRASIPCA
jgi:signal transduction histidine kinase